MTTSPGQTPAGASAPSGDGVLAWLVGGLLVGLVLLAGVLVSYKVGYDHGRDSVGAAPAETRPVETQPAETQPAETQSAAADGAAVFADAGCSSCHTLSAAGASGTVGPIHVAAPGVGVDDGFTSYKAFVGDPPRTRWGDYGAAVTDGSSIWIASEYIAQTCALTGSPTSFYPIPPSTAGFGSCDATRTSLANWSTRMSKLTP